MILLKLIQIQNCFNDSIKLTLLDQSNSLKFKAGQFLTIILNQDANLFKSFSISSTPAELPQIELSFRLTDDEFSHYVSNKLVVNEIIYALSPEGEFVFDSSMIKSKNIIFFAIGSGITPIFSILKTELEKSSDINFYLFWGNKNIGKAFYWDEIKNLGKTFHRHFNIINFFSEAENYPGSLNGRMNSQTIFAELSARNVDLKDSEFFISGSNGFVKTISKYLCTQNIEKDKIHFEKYDYHEIKNKIENELRSLMK